MTDTEQRGIKEICLAIEELVKSQKNVPGIPISKPPTARPRPRRLSDQQKEVLFMAFEECRGPKTIRNILDLCQELEPDLFPTQCGSLSRSITCAIAERAGLKVGWSQLAPFPGRNKQS